MQFIVQVSYEIGTKSVKVQMYSVTSPKFSGNLKFCFSFKKRNIEFIDVLSNKIESITELFFENKVNCRLVLKRV